jgi:hypothetical protein
VFAWKIHEWNSIQKSQSELRTAAADKMLVCLCHRHRHKRESKRFARCTEPHNPATSEYLSGLKISFAAKCSHCVMLNSDLTNVLTLIKVTNLKMSRYVFNYISCHYGSPPHHTHYTCFYVNYNTVMILRRRKIRYLNLCSEHIHLQWVVNNPLYFNGNAPSFYSSITFLIFSFIHFLSISSFFSLLRGK